MGKRSRVRKFGDKYFSVEARCSLLRFIQFQISLVNPYFECGKKYENKNEKTYLKSDTFSSIVLPVSPIGQQPSNILVKEFSSTFNLYPKFSVPFVDDALSSQTVSETFHSQHTSVTSPPRVVIYPTYSVPFSILPFTPPDFSAQPNHFSEIPSSRHPNCPPLSSLFILTMRTVYLHYLQPRTKYQNQHHPDSHSGVALN